jgi:hypothetical protein
MAISRGKQLLEQSNPNPDDIRKSIAALEVDAEHIRKCIKSGLRDYDSGQESIVEIRKIIEQLQHKL